MKDLKDMLNESRGDIDIFDKDIEKKSEEIADYVSGETDYKESAAYDAAIHMAYWIRDEYNNWISDVLLLKFLYFLNEKEKSTNNKIDDMDWPKIKNEFLKNLKK